jgi:hypothetical protein
MDAAQRRARRRDYLEAGPASAQNSRLFRSYEQAELVGGIADTRTTFEGGDGRQPDTLFDTLSDGLRWNLWYAADSTRRI